MPSDDHRGSAWILVSVIAFVLAITAGYFVFVGAAERLIENASTTQIEGSARILAKRLHRHTDDLLAEFREVVARCGGRDAGAVDQCAGDLARLRQRLPGLVAGTAVFDPAGEVLVSWPVRPWEPEVLAAVRAYLREGEPAGDRPDRVQGAVARGGSDFFVFAVLPSASRSRIGGVGVALDVAQEAKVVLEDASLVEGGVAFLALEDGRLMGVAGPERWQSLSSLAGLLDAEWPVLSGRLKAAASSGQSVLRSTAATGNGRMLGVVEQVELPGSALIVGEFAPAVSLGRSVRPILLGGSVLMTLTLAGLVAALAAWTRANAARGIALHETARWRDLAQEKRREGRWRGLADRCTAPMVCLSGSTIVAANRCAADSLAGGDVQRLLGRDFLDFAAADDREPLRRHLSEQSHPDAERHSTAARMVTADGRTFVAELAVTAVRELDDEQVYAAWEEVGARPGGEGALGAVADAVPQALVLTDRVGNLLWANAAAFDRVGSELRRLRGKPLLSLVERSHRRVALGALARARRGRAAGGEVRFLDGGGNPTTVAFEAVPVRADDALIGVLFVAPEIATRVVGGREPQAVTREKALAELSASLAHRVRNNVQALLGLLEQFGTCKEAERTLSVARRLVADAVEDLRRFFVAASRSDAGTLRPVRLGPVVERWVERVTPVLPPGVRITAKREVSDDRVVADPEQITLWLDVTLSAAVSAMELGGAVEVELAEGGETGSVRLTFSDTGSSGETAGLPAERQRFSSRHASRALAELVAARLGGRSGGTSWSGLRSRLWIELQRVRGGLGAGETGRAVARSGPVLIADDEEMVRMSLATALRSAGYEVVEAKNGLEVVERVLATPDRFALVVLDLVMPVMDGREALRRLRECAPTLPVVICTGYDPSGDEVLTAAAVLIKPFTIAELLDKVAEFTEQHPAGGGNGGNLT